MPLSLSGCCCNNVAHFYACICREMVLSSKLQCAKLFGRLLSSPSVRVSITVSECPCLATNVLFFEQIYKYKFHNKNQIVFQFSALPFGSQKITNTQYGLRLYLRNVPIQVSILSINLSFKLLEQSYQIFCIRFCFTCFIYTIICSTTRYIVVLTSLFTTGYYYYQIYCAYYPVLTAISLAFTKL